MTALGNLSRLLSRVTGGKPGQSLCSRFRHDCLFCRFVGWVLRDPDHCWDEWLKDIKRRG